jgi:hypothetical protein
MYESNSSQRPVEGHCSSPADAKQFDHVAKRGDQKMPVESPDQSQLASVAARYGLGLSDGDVTSFGPMVRGVLASWDAVEELYSEVAPTAPDRAWTQGPGKVAPNGVSAR